jgi:hypothetical protein
MAGDRSGRNAGRPARRNLEAAVYDESVPPINAELAEPAETIDAASRPARQADRVERAVTYFQLVLPEMVSAISAVSALYVVRYRTDSAKTRQ